MTTSLDLGCGSTPRNPFNASKLIGLDQFPVADLQADLVWEPIPLDDNSVDYVTAYDFLEHLPRVLYFREGNKYPFIDVMSEVWRVLKPEGTFFSSTPAYPYAAAFQDPTHVNFVTPETFAEYFDDHKTWARKYGFKGQFSIDKMLYEGPHLQVWMRKVLKNLA